MWASAERELLCGLLCHRCDVGRCSQVRTLKMGSRLGTGSSAGRNTHLARRPSRMAAWAGEHTHADIGYRPNLSVVEDGGREEGRDEVLHSRQQNRNHRFVAHSK